jgi:hypothetical protein
MGTNIPGKPKEALSFLGGLPYYLKSLQDALESNLKSFDMWV